MNQSFWLSIDENGDETIHQYEPYYNQLHMKWMSNNKIHLAKGISNLIVDYDMSSLVKAISFEISGIINMSSKVVPVKIKRIYKG